MIAPGVLQLTTCLLRTDGGLPTVGVPETVTTAMHHATTREAHELRMEVGECLSQILTQAVPLISILGHQRYHIYIHITIVKSQNHQRSFLAG